MGASHQVKNLFQISKLFVLVQVQLEQFTENTWKQVKLMQKKTKINGRSKESVMPVFPNFQVNFK